jgi:hypothetical protein
LLLVCVLPLPSAHEAAGATGIRRSPRPLWAEDSSTPRAHCAARSRTRVWIWKSCLELAQTPSFRGDAKHRTRNLEIPRCVIAHLRSGPADHPGMTASRLLRRFHLCSLSYRGQVAPNDARNNLILLRALSSPCALARPSDALSWWGDASPGVRENAPTAWRMPCLSGFAAAHPSG